MKLASIMLLAIIITVSVSSRKKDTFITSPNASVSLSVDTLYYDTVFTTTGSITQYFKIFNNNNQKLLLSNVQLMGGANSYFKFNLDGSPGTTFNGITLAANDSLYGFVTVSINPRAGNLPFLISDSIRIVYNGDTTFLQLRAYGQNANFLKNATITHDTTWTNSLPVVISGGVTVNAGATLTIQKGTNVYVNANAAILVNGTLQAVGDTSHRITFQCDRLDAPYNTFPGSWPGIYFTSTSVNNLMQYCNINNGYEGVFVLGPVANNTTVLTLNQCIINNIYDVGIGGYNTSISATSCLVSNCGSNVAVASGGTYNFNQCTIASYDNSYISHINPVVTISNADSNYTPYTLNCTITNSILYGQGSTVADEAVVAKATSGTTTPAFNITFNNVLYKDADAINSDVTLNNCILNAVPGFVNIDAGNLVFDFHLPQGSPYIGKGMSNPSIVYDLDGNVMPNPPSIGCYEK